MYRSFKRLGSVVFATMIACGTISSADAVPILSGSVINFAGQSTCTAAGCVFGSAIVTGGTGSFSSFTFGTSATFFPVSFGSFTPGESYTTTDLGGRTASFFSTARDSFTTDRVDGLTSYTITNAGVARLTGFDDALGFYLFTANQDGAIQGSFSATSNAVAAVPEPATWAMMILGMGTAGMALRRKKVVTRVTFA